MTSKSMTQSTELFKQSPQPWRPHAYQKRAVKFLLEHACAGLLLDPGLGKTSAALGAIKYLKTRGVINKVLIIAPLRVCYRVWPAERDKWTDFHGLRVAVLHGKHKDSALACDADVYVINPEGLDWLLQTDKSGGTSKRKAVVVDARRFARLGFDTLIIDELSKFKASNTYRFKAMKQVLPTFRRRWGLTGSPAPNGLLDLFGQCYMLDEGNALGRYITHYRSQFFYNPPHSPYEWKLLPGAEERIYARLAPLALRMAAEDYLELPELTQNTVYVDLPDDVMAAYGTLEAALFTELNGNVVTAANAAVASGKCRQLASGGLYLDPADELEPVFRRKKNWAHAHNAKVDALEELVAELQGEPLLVAYDFKHDLERLRARFGKDVPVLGKGSAKQDAVLEAAWNAGQLPLLLGHPQSIGHGLNLQGACRHVCWHTLTWDYELYDQFIRRVYRQGNKAMRVVVHHLIARGTIDEAVLAALRGKAEGQRALFDALKALQNRRLK